MKATVVVSCYNQKKYITECLDSILNQEVNFEYNIIVSDDCSTDGTQEIIMQYQAINPEKITVITHGCNVGPAQNYFDAHGAANGDIVFHFDGDDVMLPQKLQKQFDVFKANPAVNVVFHRALYFSDDGQYSTETGCIPGATDGVLFFGLKDLALWGTVAPHSSYCFRKSARNLAHPTKEFMEWYFAMDVLLQDGQGAYINEILIKYRCNPKGNAYLSNKSGRTKSYTYYLNDLLYFFQKSPQLRSELYSNCLVTFLAMLKNGCSAPKKIPLFLIKNLHLLRLSNFKKTITTRKSVSPLKKIR